MRQRPPQDGQFPDHADVYIRVRDRAGYPLVFLFAVRPEAFPTLLRLEPAR